MWGLEGDEEVEGTDSPGNLIHLKRIHPYLEMCMQAYEDVDMKAVYPFVKESKLICDLQEPTSLNFVFDLKTDTEAHVCILENGTLVFVFRGTEVSSSGDIVTDLKYKQKPVELYDASDEIAYEAPSSIKVHEGFQIAFRDITRTPRCNENLRLVAEGLGANARNVKRAVCVGHSLGGALATLCAYWCRYVAYPEAEIWCITMGSPRVGNDAFARDFNENVANTSYRVVNKGDGVPSLPHFLVYPKPFSAYAHVDELIYLYEHPKSKDTICLKCGGHRPYIFIPRFDDHKCSAYKSSIQKVLANISRT